MSEYRQDCCACNRTEHVNLMTWNTRNGREALKKRGWVFIPHAESALCPTCVYLMDKSRGGELTT